MPGATVPGSAPGLSLFIKSLKGQAIEDSVEQLISLLKRRQIRTPGPCALATTHLLLRVVAGSKLNGVKQLLEKVRNIGRQLQAAQPKEPTIGNIIRRALGLIREVAESPAVDVETGTNAKAGQALLFSNMTPLIFPFASASSSTSAVSPDASIPSIASTSQTTPTSIKDIKDDVLNGLREILDELDQADEQIAAYSLEQIHADEVLLTYTSSLTVQKFLLHAAKKRKFSVFIVEGYPNEHEATFDTALHGSKKSVMEDAESPSSFSTDNDSQRLKSLVSAGVSVTIIPDSVVFAVMARVDKVILPSHTILPNGGVVTAAGASVIATAAKAHRVPVIVLGGIYKLSPLYPYNPDTLLDHGDAGKVVDFRDGKLAEALDVLNPLQDFLQPELVDLFLTNIGGHAPEFMYRIAADHYRQEDIEL